MQRRHSGLFSVYIIPLWLCTRKSCVWRLWILFWWSSAVCNCVIFLSSPCGAGLLYSTFTKLTLFCECACTSCAQCIQLYTPAVVQMPLLLVLCTRGIGYIIFSDLTFYTSLLSFFYLFISINRKFNNTVTTRNNIRASIVVALYSMSAIRELTGKSGNTFI